MTMLIRFTRNADSPWSLRLGLLLAVLTLWWAAPTRADDSAPAGQDQKASAEPADNDNESDDPDPEEAEEEKKGDEPSEKEASGKKEGTAKDDPGEKDKSSDKPDPKAEDDKGESGDAKKATTPQKGPRPTRAADLAAKRRALRERERERAEARRRLTEQRRAGKSGEASEGTERPGAMPKSTTQPAGDDELGEAVGDIDDQEMDPDAEAALLEALANRPAEERTYQFAFEDIDYADLLDAFSRMSGLAVIGDPPTGKVTFKTTEEMDFKTALSRINLLLFKHRENYWMVLEDNILEVSRLTERPRDLDVEDIFPSVAAFEAAERDDNDLVMLIYSPERGSVEALDEIRDFLPDYVRSAPLSDPSKNAMTIFALVKDINKFLDLVELFDEPGKDPRVIKKIVLEHIMPSEAIDSLGQLMDLSGGRAGTRTVKKGGRATVVRSGPSRGISILPDDAQQVLIVRALQSDIDEIERLLPFIDVDTSDDSEFVVIPLKHVNTATMMQGLRPLLRASGETVGAAPKAPKKRRGARGPATAGEVAGANATVVPEPRTNKLIVVGSDEGIERVREIVALLDVESEGDRPTFVRLEYADPAALAAEITPLVHQLRPQAGFTATPDEASNSLALIGTRQAIELAQELIARADVEGATPSPHKIRLEEAKPSDVAAMLSRFDTGAPAKPTPRARPKKGSRPTPRRSTVGGAGKFIADDATGMLYVVCTDIVWEKTYLPRIQEMEEDARRPIEKHIVAVTDADPQTVIDTLNTIVGGETGDAVKMVAVPDGIMLVDATQHEIDEIKELIDVFNFDPEAGFERKVFEIEHAEPSAVRDIVMTMMSSGPVRPQSRIQPKRKGGRPSPRATAPSAAPEIKIVEVGRSLMVYAPAEKMEEIGQLIAEVDVDTAVTDIRIYPFPAGVNVQDVANTLTTLYGGRSVRTQPKRRGKTPTPARPTTVGRVTIIAQPAAHSILVSAPIDEFDRIEETLQKIGTDVTQVDVIYDFIDVQHGSAATIAGLIDPILKNKLNQLMDTGEIPRPAGTGPKSPATQSLLTLQPDPADDRLIIAAPELIVAEARSLVTALDRADSSERVMRTVTLDKADPDEMAQTIQAMLSGQRAAPRRPQQPRQRGKAQPARPASRVGSGAELDVTITTAHGGGGWVLLGLLHGRAAAEASVPRPDAAAPLGAH
ncbi:MAG: hypothetical protein GY778_25760 [bacterium]|nr:hypothetical protein [bacterium]